jgi:hypothetical protein
MAGRLLLQLAVVVHRGIANRTAVRAWKLRRNEVLRAAHRRGVPVDVLAARVGSKQSWVRYVIKNPRRAAVEEAA